MEIVETLVIDTGIAAARARLARLVRGGCVSKVVRDAQDGAATRLIRLGPAGKVPGASKLALVRVVGPVRRDTVTTVWLRAQATGPASGLFPVLDADVTVTAEGLGKTRLTLTGCYRPPFGRVGAGLDRAVMHHTASATIRALLHSIAAALDEPPGAVPAGRARSGREVVEAV